MPAAVPFPLRRALWLAAQQGLSTAQLAERFGLPVRTVRHLLHRGRAQGNQPPVAAYRGPDHPPRWPAAVVEAVTQLKRAHPDWGAGFLRGVLAENYPDQDLPGERTLRRLLRGLGRPPAPPGRRRQRPARVTVPHQRWQVDAADQMPLADGTLVSWLRGVDECSGAVLGTVVFPQGQFNQVPPAQIQDCGRDWFARWGLPGELRLDNGCPWGGWYDLPTALELWLAGLEVGVLFNPPRQPQHNGVIENSNGCGQRWAEVSQCGTVTEVQEHVNFADRIQREQLRSIAGQSRQRAFPGLTHSSRRYERRWEEDNWSLEKAETVLESCVASRQVTAQGRITLCYRKILVGKAEAGHRVRVQYDSGSKMWIVSRTDGQPLRAVPAPEITRDRIVTLTTYERP